MSMGMKEHADLIAAGLKTTSSVGTVYLETTGFKSLHAVVTLITTSGTIAGASCWLEGSLDGENWWPMPLDTVIQSGPANLTTWGQIGAGGVVNANATAGFYPLMLMNIAATVTASGQLAGTKMVGGLPVYVRAAYIINTNNGALNFMLRAMAST